MSRLLTAMLVLALLAIGAPAHASVLYQFTTTSVTLSGTPGPGPFTGVSPTLVLSDAAVRAGHLASPPGVSEECSLDPALGVEAWSFFGGGGLPPCYQGPAYPSQRQLSYDLRIVGPFLTGSLFIGLQDHIAQIVIASVRPNLWRGLFFTDDLTLGCNPAGCGVEGVWRRVGSARVPGPPETTLLLVGGLALAGLARKVRRSRPRDAARAGC